MDLDCIGKDVSLDCGSLGFYQGRIKHIQIDESLITIESPFQNGKPCDVPTVTLSATNILDIKFLEAPQSIAQSNATSENKSTVQVVKKKPRNLVSENLAKVTQRARFSPAMQQTSRTQSPKKLNGGRGGVAQGQFKGQAGPGMMNKGGSRRERDRMRDDACFGDINEDEIIGKEFDFESNLALFDKKLVFEEIEDEMGGSNQPDVVRLVDCNLRREAEPKFRNDENVLLSTPAQYRPIDTGERPSPGEYVTNSGLIVPAVSYELRSRLEKVMEAKGLELERTTELIARAAVELTIQMFGGAHRLNPDNSHQLPLVVVLCGPNKAGAFGIATARHLATQGVKTHLYLPDLPHYPDHIKKEIALYKLTGQQWTTNSKDLPKNTVDLIISAMEDHEMWQQERRQPWLRNATAWANSTHRSSALFLDPPTEPTEHAISSNSKVCLLPGLPLWHTGNDDKIYLVNLCVPKKVYDQVGIKFSSPFGAKTVIPLHRVS